MIGRVCLLLEALSIVICLHHLYGEKFKLDIKTVGFLAIDMIMMTAIDYYGLPSTLSIIIYLIIALYCGLEFGFEWKKIIINNILYMVIVSSIQLAITFIYYNVFKIRYVDGVYLLIANTIILIIMIFLLPKCNIKKWFGYLKNRNYTLILALLICILVVMFFLISYKNLRRFALYQSMVLFMCLIFIGVLAIQLGKAKVKEKEIETELKMHELYANSFSGLIENIRRKQHEFDNHINAIYSQHYLCRTYEELVDVQKNYCKIVTKENRYNKLLTNGNSIVIGFLYGKFVEMEEHGIDINYQINIGELKVAIPVYKIIEILGNLLNNATEAVEKYEGEKRVTILMFEKEGEFELEIRNCSKLLEYEKLNRFFEKGYSDKGKNRGLGLYNVKRICEEYSLNIIVNSMSIDRNSWVIFKVNNKKEFK